MQPDTSPTQPLTDGDTSSDTSSRTSSPKTYVLMHGAWSGGWCWERVAGPLRAAGHRVFTPTQTGLGERAHLLSREITLDVFVDDLVQLLAGEDLQQVVLVGHSFGGIAITGAADRVPGRIRQLVYLDALILQDGQSPFGVIPAEVAAQRRQLAQDFSGGLSMPVPDPALIGMTEPQDVAWVLARMTPHPLSTYESALHLQAEVGNGLPATYVAVKPDYPPTVASRAYARSRSDWHYLEVEATHNLVVTSPQWVVGLLAGL